MIHKTDEPDDATCLYTALLFNIEYWHGWEWHLYNHKCYEM